MAVRLVFLGRLEDAAGGAEREVPAGTLAAVLAALEPHLAAVLAGERIRLALNGELLGKRATDAERLALGDGDELAFLPPVSGG